MIFKYKAKTRTGQVIEGTIEASDKFAVLNELRTKGQTAVSIEMEGKKSRSVDDFLNKIFGRVKTSELVVFTKNLSGMIKAGLSLSRALSVLEKQTKNQTLKKVITSLIGDINAGGTLSSGLAKYPKVFSKLFVSMSKAGEESGNLAGALTEVGLSLEKAHALTRKVKGAMIYPAVILSAMILVGILLFIFIVPTLSKTFEDLGVELPNSTKAIIALGDFFSNNVILTFVILIALVVGFIALFKAKFMKKYIDFVVIRIPAIGKIARELNTARTARTMASLLISGVAITRAIDITEDVVQNVYYKKVLAESKVRVEKGAPFSQVFEENQKLYPIMMSEMIQVGEETGKLSDMLLDVASFYELEIETKTKSLSTIIEPVLMIIIGAGVGFFAVSMITPLYSVLDTI